MPKETMDLREVFKHFDADRSGKIDTKEMGRIVKLLKLDSSPDKVRQLMKECDPSGDGQISFKEFESVLSKQIKGGGGGGLAAVVNAGTEQLGWFNPLGWFGGAAETSAPPTPAKTPKTPKTNKTPKSPKSYHKQAGPESMRVLEEAEFSPTHRMWVTQGLVQAANRESAAAVKEAEAEGKARKEVMKQRFLERQQQKYQAAKKQEETRKQQQELLVYQKQYAGWEMKVREHEPVPPLLGLDSGSSCRTAAVPLPRACILCLHPALTPPSYPPSSHPPHPPCSQPRFTPSIPRPQVSQQQRNHDEELKKKEFAATANTRAAENKRVKAKLTKQRHEGAAEQAKANSEAGKRERAERKEIAKATKEEKVERAKEYTSKVKHETRREVREEGKILFQAQRDAVVAAEKEKQKEDAIAIEVMIHHAVTDAACTPIARCPSHSGSGSAPRCPRHSRCPRRSPLAAAARTLHSPAPALSRSPRRPLH